MAKQDRWQYQRVSLVTLLVVLAAVLSEAAELGPRVADVLVAASERKDDTQATGSCGYGLIAPTSWPFGASISIHSNSSLVKGLPYKGCGACFKITCAGKDCRNNTLPVLGLVTDSCPTCTASADLINIPIARFVSLSNIPGANVTATVQQVDCMPPSNITIRILNNPKISLMLELVLLNVRGSDVLKAVDLKNSQQDDSAWVPMEVFNGAIWQAGNLPPPPFDLRVKNQDDQVVVARGFYTGGAGGDAPTDIQFPASAMPPIQGALSPGEELAKLRGPEAPGMPRLAGAPMPAPAPFDSNMHLPGEASSLLAPGPLSPGSLAPGSLATDLLVPAPAPGPAGANKCPGDTRNVQVVNATVPSDQPCRSLLSVLEASPSLSKWLKLLQDRGLANALANPSQQLTMFAPIDSAFTCNIFAGSNSLGATIDQIVNTTQTSVAAIVGGQVVPGYYPSSRLHPGLDLNTTDQIQKNGERSFIELQVAPSAIDGLLQMQGVGSIAKVLVQDIEACGPSVMHVTDRFLLPFAPQASNSAPAGEGPVARATDGPPSITIAFP